jgi:type I restriction enzyme S subunit
MQTRSEVKNEFKETEIGLIPENWKVVKLGEIITYQKGRKPDNLTKEYQNGCKPYLTAEYFRTGKSKQFVNLGDTTSFVEVDKEDIVLIWDGTNAGDVFTGLSGVLASTMVKIYPKDNVIRSFLFYFLKTKFNVLNSQTTGSTIPHINKMVLENIQVALPPLSEQQKIAFVLSKIQQAIQQQDKIIEATKNLKKSLMHKLFTEGTRGEEQKETEIGLIPKSWDIKNLGDVAKLTSGGTPNRKVSQYFGGTIPWVKSGELEDNIIFDTEEKITEEGLRNSSAKIFPRGTLLIAMYGATVGKTAILGIDAATNQAVCAVFPKNNILTTEFLRYYIIFARHRLLSERFGGAQPNISQTILRNIRIVIPSLTEQQEIACVLTNIDKKIEIEERRKATLQQLFKTMLNKLMTGEIRVKDLNLGVTNVS